jgi:hypothetical protein
VTDVPVGDGAVSQGCCGGPPGGPGASQNGACAPALLALHCGSPIASVSGSMEFEVSVPSVLHRTTQISTATKMGSTAHHRTDASAAAVGSPCCAPMEEDLPVPVKRATQGPTGALQGRHHPLATCEHPTVSNGSSSGSRRQSAGVSDALQSCGSGGLASQPVGQHWRKGGQQYGQLLLQPSRRNG